MPSPSWKYDREDARVLRGRDRVRQERLYGCAVMLPLARSSFDIVQARSYLPREAVVSTCPRGEVHHAFAGPLRLPAIRDELLLRLRSGWKLYSRGVCPSLAGHCFELFKEVDELGLVD